MMWVQLQKIIRDLWIYRMRTGLSILAICVGLVIFGGAATSHATLDATYNGTFRQSKPAQVAIQIPAFDESLISRIDDDSLIAEGRYVTSETRLGIAPNRWLSVELQASDDFINADLYRIFPDTNISTLAPPRGTVWFDRSILQLDDLRVGDVVGIQGSDGEVHELTISGFVNDIIAFPTGLSDRAIAYVSLDTLRDMQMAMYVRPRQPAYNQLLLRFDLPTGAVIRIRDRMTEIESRILLAGYEIISIDYLTDEPPLKAQTDTLNTIMIFGTLISFAVTGVLIGNFVSAIVGRQINEIGIMKSLGAVPAQIISMFFIMMVMMGLLAFVLSLFFTGFAAQTIGDYIANLIDIDVLNIRVPLNVRWFQFFSAIFIPITAALVPILQGSLITVQETLRSDGNVRGGLSSWLIHLPSLFIPSIVLQMAFRNIFLKPGRLVLTAASLTLPGAMFISAYGIEVALQNLDAELSDTMFRYDIELSFNGTESLAQIERLAERQDGVIYVEAWRQGSIHRVYSVPYNQPSPPLGSPPLGDPSSRPGNTPPDLLPPDNAQPNISGDIPLRGVPIDSEIIYFAPDQLFNGGWLHDDSDIFLTYEAYELFTLDVDGSNTVLVESDTQSDYWDIVGVTGNLLFAEAFVDINTFEKFVPLETTTIRLAIRTDTTSVTKTASILENLRDMYQDEAIPVIGSISMREFVERRAGRVGVVTKSLIVVSIMLGIVSVIGLISTISINIRERTKSLGILRSLGGDYRHLGAMVFAESLTIVLISYVLAFALSYVVGDQLSNLFSNQIYSLDSLYTMEWYGTILWFVIIVLVGMIAATGPAWYAINITISDTLRYEG